MGRPKGGKAKRPTSQATKSEDGDAGSGEEEAVMPVCKRRGRPQKHLKADDDTDEEEEDSVNKAAPIEDSDGAKPVVPGKGSAESGGKKRRRRRRQPSKRGCDPATEEKGEAVVKQSGFRHHGSRRKSTPRRAAEAGVECK
ncbi:hypothetical protein BAE44_0022014 [Dichanthelium oligosanthes]|uniref:Uncharacterized protein n=1 Tax=Dichanthelium oligosanthes TaxID=888268 RepID=A0A1E5UVQ8_9POAL|nr:hypothetical protein BAE44_0022014 [Dichanthelium oligosanthes]